MKVGVLSRSSSMDLEEQLRLWSLGTTLKNLNADVRLCCFGLHQSESALESVQRRTIKKKIRKFLFPMEQEEVKSTEIPLLLSSEFSVSSYEDSGTLGLENLRSMTDISYFVTNDLPLYEALLEEQKTQYDKFCYLTEPALLSDAEHFRSIASNLKINKKFMLVDCVAINAKKKEMIKRIAKARGCAIVHNAMELHLPKTLETYQRSEFQKFLGYALAADCILTDTYAGCYIAAVFDKDFAVFQEKESQINDFIKRYSLERHILTDLSKYQGDLDDRLQVNTAFHDKRKTYSELQKGVLLNTLHINDLCRKVDCPTDILRSECCGCCACSLVCPKNAIRMKEDFEGFLYPVVNPEKCIHCMLCTKVCVKRDNPQTITYEENYPKIYAVMNKDEEVRSKSSSGAIFPELCRFFIETLGGVVVGVKYNNKMQAVSEMTDTMKGCVDFYGAKYVKSRFAKVFALIKEQLNAGRYVLYSGLPCEAAALKAYLKKEYEHLLICENLCHASPSPKAFRKYIQYLNKKYKSPVVNIRFRDKGKGWRSVDNRMVIEFKNREPVIVNARKNNYYRCFSKDIIARPGCADCSFTYDNRVGDITMGDFWGIQNMAPELYDNKGISILMLNTKKGESIWKSVEQYFLTKEFDLTTALKYNHKKPILLKEERNAFFQRLDFEKTNDLLESYNDLAKKDGSSI